MAQQTTPTALQCATHHAPMRSAQLPIHALVFLDTKDLTNLAANLFVIAIVQMGFVSVLTLALVSKDTSWKKEYALLFAILLVPLAGARNLITAPASTAFIPIRLTLSIVFRVAHRTASTLPACHQTLANVIPDTNPYLALKIIVYPFAKNA